MTAAVSPRRQPQSSTGRFEVTSVLATSVTDLFGNQTRIRFDKLEENLNPEPDTFVLKIPAGVEVIDYAESRPR